MAKLSTPSDPGLLNLGFESQFYTHNVEGVADSIFLFFGWVGSGKASRLF